MFEKFLRRFEKLEHSAAAKAAQGGVRISKRFEFLEVGDRRIEFTVVDKVISQEKAPPQISYFHLCFLCGADMPMNIEVCPHCQRSSKTLAVAKSFPQPVFKRCICGTLNRKEKTHCWVCGRDFSQWGDRAAIQSPHNVITLNIDGKIYKSDDAVLPQDVLSLMGRIRKEGYSQKLVDEWVQEKKKDDEMKKDGLKFQLADLRSRMNVTIFQLIIAVIALVLWVRSCHR